MLRRAAGVLLIAGLVLAFGGGSAFCVKLCQVQSSACVDLRRVQRALCLSRSVPRLNALPVSICAQAYCPACIYQRGCRDLRFLHYVNLCRVPWAQTRLVCFVTRAEGSACANLCGVQSSACVDLLICAACRELCLFSICALAQHPACVNLRWLYRVQSSACVLLPSAPIPCLCQCVMAVSVYCGLIELAWI